ncbi:MAG: hypothetical protein ACXADL_15375 [Candidatus Thorarchaeota archaeon]|jgi:hypothetical protein
MSFPSDDELIKIGTDVHADLSDGLDGRRDELCSYGIGWSDGTVLDLDTNYCHATLRNLKFKIDIDYQEKEEGPCVIANKMMYGYLGRRRKEEGHKKSLIVEYSNFLMNDSVFSECIVNKDISKLDEQGIIVRTDKPPNLVAAACIASRQAWEHSHVAVTTLRLIKEGVPPRVAEIVSYIAILTKDDTLQMSYTSGHSPMILGGMGNKTIKAILASELDMTQRYNRGTYQDVMSYQDLCRMWGGMVGMREPIKFTSYGHNKKKSDPFGLLKYADKPERTSLYQQVMEQFKEFL